MRYLICFIFTLGVCVLQAQLYTLKDPKKDSMNMEVLYDSLPIMCDSFYVMLLREDLTEMKKFVPRMKYLKSTFDTMAIEYREEQVVYRQQMLLHNLQKDYKKILKYSEKSRLNIKRLEKGKTIYDYGRDEQENKYCYVTVLCTKNGKEDELKYLAILLNGHWFVGDELKLGKL